MASVMIRQIQKKVNVAGYHRYKETDSIHSVSLYLKSHPFWVALYIVYTKVVPYISVQNKKNLSSFYISKIHPKRDEKKTGDVMKRDEKKTADVMKRDEKMTADVMKRDEKKTGGCYEEG